MRIALLLPLLALPLRADNAEPEQVVALTTDAFDQFLTDNQLVFAEFYAPWCGHCKAMANDYEQLAQRLKADGSAVKVVKIDATVESELATRFAVKGFPTLKLFVSGVPLDYKGGRTEKEMYDWLLKKAQSKPETLAFTDESKLHAQNISVLFLAPEGDAEAEKAFSALTLQFDEIPFFAAHDKQFWDKFEVKEKYGFLVFRSFDEGPKFLVNDTLFSTDAMRQFLESMRHPLVSDFSQETAERIFGGEKSAIFLFADQAESAVSKVFHGAAKAVNDLVFSTSTIASGMGAKLAEFLGVTTEHQDEIRLIKFEGDNVKKFKCSDATEEGIAKCVTDFQAGTLAPYFKSQPVPTEQAAVHVIVGDNFQAEVLDADKHVLVEAYAPWCGHCKKLEPIYQQLAEKLAHVPELVIAKMDAAANEHPGMQVRAFPTIRLFKRGDKTAPVEFDGKRELADLIDFLKRETGLALDVKPEEL